MCGGAPHTDCVCLGRNREGVARSRIRNGRHLRRGAARSDTYQLEVGHDKSTSALPFSQPRGWGKAKKP